MADITTFPIPTEVLDPANYPEFIGPTGATGATGPQGDTGPAGADGADGVGVPAGGTTGQVLAKASGTDYDTEWVAPGVQSNTTDITGADAVTNIVSLTQAEYDAIGTPNAATLYIITG